MQLNRVDMQYPPPYFGTHPFGFRSGYFQNPMDQYQPYNPYYPRYDPRYDPRPIDTTLLTHQFNHQPTTPIHDSKILPTPIHDSKILPMEIPARFPTASGSSPITSGSSPSIDPAPAVKRPRNKKAGIPVPESKKDALYRAKRDKNNESAKKSRAMRKAKAARVSKELARLKQVRIQLRGDIQFFRSNIAQLEMEVNSPLTDPASVFHHLAGPSAAAAAVQYM